MIKTNITNEDLNKNLIKELHEILNLINYENQTFSLEEIYSFLEEKGISTKQYCPGMSIKEYFEDLRSVGVIKQDAKKRFHRVERQKTCARNIVCLCGSTKFKDAFVDATREESIKGNIVLSVAMFGHLEGLDMSGEVKKTFDEIHFDKIKLADEVFVLNVGGYIGESTKREIDFAKSLGKRIRFLEN